ncbi:biotin--[acetyl-CoA-carboxylase] ligase [Trueperella sp. LYQ143]|uniref:biotin--[acetyl-CoA-carboxylase] ligase n=1 Tax=unclassified Trueperella TaxID=2630174 RepID=UPI0039831ACC
MAAMEEITIVRLADVDSTNDEVRRRLAAHPNTPAGWTVCADHQSAGRGRYQRQWLDEPGQSLLFSTWTTPQPHLLNWVSPSAGIACVRTLHRWGYRNISLKWPNDILLRTDTGYAKAGGILCEFHEQPEGVIVGIGMNWHSVPRSCLTAITSHTTSADGPTPTHTLANSTTRHAGYRTADSHITAEMQTNEQNHAHPHIRTHAKTHHHLDITHTHPLSGPAAAICATNPSHSGVINAPAPTVMPSHLHPTALIPDILHELHALMHHMTPSQLHAAYRQHLTGLGQPLKIALASGKYLTGIAQDVDEAGALILHTSTGYQRITCADVSLPDSATTPGS